MQTTTKPSTAEQVKLLTNAPDLLDFFDIGFDSGLMHEWQGDLIKRFNGYVLLTKPQDWFDYRRCLKNAYCKVQRSRLDRSSKTRVACRGCTSCERR
ncbi:nitrogen fixation protein NifW [Moritella marina ATCC 15381]|uniref:Nitrogen fixation protein NifW n=1 Tax=Moritella marina ATCC 15381 TaxID=1202962 RepID=A0A5J6WPB1_MORMI|nr:nitrogen fixation NifW family protein [Moritella marina]QFI38272.1 nitrogen fixation protein NifW [Moritella marina ATCC 15381]